MTGYIPQWHLEVVEVPITVTLAAYTAADSVGGLLTSDNIPQINGGGYINWVRLVDDTGQAEPFKLWCFYEAHTTSIADAAQYLPVEADRLVQFTTIDLPAANYDTTGVDSTCWGSGKDFYTGDYHIFPALSNNLMYFYLVAGDTPDYADADDLTLHIGFMLK